MSPRQSRAQAFDTSVVERPRSNHLTHGRSELAGCYTVRDICRLLAMSRRTFYDLKNAGELTFLEELKPRLGRVVRFRASLVDAYLNNRLNRAV